MGMQGVIPPNIDYSKSVSDGYKKKIYKKGETCIKYNKLYQAKEDIDEPEEWNPEHWKETTVEQIRAQMQQEIEAVNTKIANITPDDTAVGGKPWTSKHIVDMLCPPLKVSGNPVQCYPVAGYPLEITASWEPTQEGTGDPSPENIRPIKGRDSIVVTRCGKNLFDVSQCTPANPDSAYGLSVKVDGDYVSISGIPVISNVSTQAQFRILFSNQKELINLACTSKAFVEKGTINWIGKISPKDKSIVISTPLSPNTEVDIALRIMLYVGDTDPDEYIPYKGDTATMDLPETTYGGSVDAVSGEGQKEWRFVMFNGTENWMLEETSTLLRFRCVIGPNTELPANTSDQFCSQYILNHKLSNAEAQGFFVHTVPYGGCSVFVGTEGRSVDEWKAYLAAQYAAGTPVQIVYKLKTPTAFSSNGNAPVKALSGVNTVLTDADTAEVTGREDLIHAIAGQ